MADKQINVRIKKINPSDIKNPELKTALEKLKEERNTQNEAVMLQYLQKARLLCPVIFSGKDPKNLQIKFVLLNTKDGKSFFPAFTDEEEAKKLNVPAADSSTNGAHSFMIRNITDYKAVFADKNNRAQGVVINPMSSNIIIPKMLVDRLSSLKMTENAEKQQLSQGNVPAGVQVTYSEPRIYPTALINAVYDKCQELKGVKRVWFKQMNAGMVISFVLIVEADDFAAVQEPIHDAAAAKAKDVPVIVQKYTEQLQKNVIKNSVALYDENMEF